MKLNKRKFFKNLFIFLLLIVLVVLGVYVWKTPEAQENIAVFYSDFLAKFKSEEIKVVEEVFSLSYDPAVQTNIVAGKNGILVINKSGVSEYTTSKNPVWFKELSISNPIIATEGNRFAIAESNGKRITSFYNRSEIWSYEGKNEINKIFINKEGFVGAIFSQAGYKSGFLLLNPEGKEVCSKLFAKTTLIDLDISPKGNMIAMIEADTTGAVVSSAISVLSDRGEILYSSLEDDILLSGVRYMDNSNIVAIGDSKLIKINKDYEKSILDDFTDKTVSGINLENEGKIIKIFRTAGSVFADKSTVQITDVNNKKTGLGEVSGVVKAVESTGNTIAVVLADRADFFDLSGKYLNSLTFSGKYKGLKLFENGSYACIDFYDTLKIVKIR